MQFRPLTPKRWVDFTELFGKQGACEGCWCMWWRQTRAESAARRGGRNRQAMKRIVESGRVPGILAYVDGRAIGWCSVAPREQYGALERSRVLKRVDDRPVWSIVCLFVAGGHRGRGVAAGLVRAAAKYAASRGAQIVEAYPSVPPGAGMAGISGFMGVPQLYERLGFREVARPSQAKIVMRLTVARRGSLPPN
jgi:GNAT superfamily N-acetyltransferase